MLRHQVIYFLKMRVTVLTRTNNTTTTIPATPRNLPAPTYLPACLPVSACLGPQLPWPPPPSPKIDLPLPQGRYRHVPCRRKATREIALSRLGRGSPPSSPWRLASHRRPRDRPPPPAPSSKGATGASVHVRTWHMHRRKAKATRDIVLSRIGRDSPLPWPPTGPGGNLLPDPPQSPATRSNRKYISLERKRHLSIEVLSDICSMNWDTALSCG